MQARPTSVTVICWILIVMSAISVFTTIKVMDDPMVTQIMSMSPIPIEVQIAAMYIGLGVSLVSAVAMLKAQNWGRLLYVGWSVFGFAVSLATSPMKTTLIPGLVVFLVISFFLFRPKANEYFGAGKAAAGA